MGITISPLWYHCNDLAQLYNISALVQLLDKCYLLSPQCHWIRVSASEIWRIFGASLMTLSFHEWAHRTWGNGWVWRIKKCHHRQGEGRAESDSYHFCFLWQIWWDLFDIYRRKLESTTSPKIHHYSPRFCVSFISKYVQHIPRVSNNGEVPRRGQGRAFLSLSFMGITFPPLMPHLWSKWLTNSKWSAFTVTKTLFFPFWLLLNFSSSFPFNSSIFLELLYFVHFLHFTLHTKDRQFS